MTQDTSTRHIELNVFLRISGVAGTGGKVKLLIRESLVKVNGEIETRNRRKLNSGDVVDYDGKKYQVKEEILR